MNAAGLLPALRAERRAARRLRHLGLWAAARAQREPAAALTVLGALVLLCLVLASVVTPGTYAYFAQVREEKLLVSFADARAGAALEAEQACTAFEPAPAQAEQPAGPLDAKSAGDYGPGALETLPRAWVQTCVENQGKEDTRGLQITAILQLKDGAAYRELQRQPVDLSAQPAVGAGQKQCYAYPIAAAYDPAQTYRAVAQISVTNLLGWLPGSENCPGEQPCRKGLSVSADFRVPASAFPSPTPSPTATETLTATASETPLPSETAVTPTETPVPSETAVLPTEPTATPPAPSETPVTPDTPEPSHTPVPPTQPPAPTDTPVPPTQPPAPTDTPIPPPPPTEPPPTEPPPAVEPSQPPPPPPPVQAPAPSETPEG